MLNENYYTEYYEVTMWKNKVIKLSEKMKSMTGKIFPISVLSSNGSKIKITFKEDTMMLHNEEDSIFSIKVWVVLSKINIDKINIISYENNDINISDWYKEKKNG